MIPGAIAFGITLGIMLENQVIELVSIENSDKLSK